MSAPLQSVMQATPAGAYHLPVYHPFMAAGSAPPRFSFRLSARMPVDQPRPFDKLRTGTGTAGAGLCHCQVVPKHLAEVRGHKLELIAKTQAAVKDRLTKEITCWTTTPNSSKNMPR